MKKIIFTVFSILIILTTIFFIDLIDAKPFISPHKCL